MEAMALASCLPFQQLAEPYWRGRYHHRHRVVAFPAADDTARRNCSSLCRHFRVSAIDGSFLQRAGTHSTRHMVAASLRSAGKLSTTGLSECRVAPVDCVCRHHNCCELHHWQPGHLCCCQLYGFGDVLRADMPSGNGTGIHGSSEFSACARRVRSMSHWPWRLLVCPQQAFGNWPGLCHAVRHLSAADSSAVHDLRPARETCETCHWPEKFDANRLNVIASFAEDE